MQKGRGGVKAITLTYSEIPRDKNKIFCNWTISFKKIIVIPGKYSRGEWGSAINSRPTLRFPGTKTNVLRPAHKL